MNLQILLIAIISLVANFTVICFSNCLKLFQPKRKEDDNKSATPTFGGISFLAVFLLLMSEDLSLFTMAFFIGVVGFVDDYLKILRKNSHGLSSLTKITMEIMIALIYLYTLPIQYTSSYNALLITMWGCLVIISTVNAVNITDGIDSLSAVVSMFCLAFLYVKTSDLLAVKLLVMLLVFLFFNFPPAALIMGDVGSLGLGAVIGGLFLKHNLEISLVLVGIVLVIETLTSLLQIIAIRCFKKRLFLLAPFHHHLFLKGWSRLDVLLLFNLLNILGFIASYFLF